MGKGDTGILREMIGVMSEMEVCHFKLRKVCTTRMWGSYPKVLESCQNDSGVNLDKLSLAKDI